jgi:hypothetical protein
MIRNFILYFIIFCVVTAGFGQDKKNDPLYLGVPMIIDSSSSSNLIIPVLYKPHIGFQQNQLRTDHYANILFYNPKTDSIKRLFKEDTYIKPFQLDYIPLYSYHNSIYSSNWIFYFVKTSDYNNNGEMDNNDPYILYVSDKNGNALKPLTPLNENALSIDIYDKQGFALIKLQQDTNENKKFGYNEWTDFYYVRLDLNTLKLHKKIQIKNPQ